VNGKRRGDLTLPADASEEEARDLVLAMPQVQKHLGAKPIKRFIYVPGKIVNVVIGK
jgi:leucyl-tRNA synthetase